MMKLKASSHFTNLPNQFYNQKTKQVSVIVPVYKSQDVIESLVESFINAANTIETEIVFADDACPNKTKNKIFEICMKYEKELTAKYSIKIIESETNRGYGGNCNWGAKHATGDYLIFLNADTKVTNNWIEPLIQHLQDEKVGIVGNLQLRWGGKFDGAVDSAGSEWSNAHKSFLHIGGRIYKGKILNNPFYIHNAPSGMLTTSERQMVTGCCVAIRKNLFFEIGMYDEQYLVGYCEDADMCMTLKERGYKVIFEPASLIYHKKHHSKSLNHPFMQRNKNIFSTKWIKNNKLKDLLKN